MCSFLSDGYGFSRRLAGLLIGAVAFVAAAPPAAAAPSLSLQTSAGFGSLTVGQTVTVNVVLSGLAAGDQLNFLGVTVGFDPLMFDVPAAITAGAIVPSPLFDPFDFLTAPAPGQADASFFTTDAAAASQITANGVFFSFQLTALAAGAGTIGFAFADATAFDPANPGVPILPGLTVSAPLAITVAPAGPGGGGGGGGPAGVPLPPAAIAGALAGAAALAAGRARRGRRPVPVPADRLEPARMEPPRTPRGAEAASGMARAIRIGSDPPRPGVRPRRRPGYPVGVAAARPPPRCR